MDAGEAGSVGDGSAVWLVRKSRIRESQKINTHTRIRHPASPASIHINKPPADGPEMAQGRSPEQIVPLVCISHHYRPLASRCRTPHPAARRALTPRCRTYSTTNCLVGSRFPFCSFPVAMEPPSSIKQIFTQSKSENHQKFRNCSRML